MRVVGETEIEISVVAETETSVVFSVVTETWVCVTGGRVTGDRVTAGSVMEVADTWTSVVVTGLVVIIVSVTVFHFVLTTHSGPGSGQ